MASPPPLRHPVPTHPAYIPEPPSTPGSPNGYQRFSSSPGPTQPQQQQHSVPQQQQHVPAYMTSPFQHSQQPQQHALHPPPSQPSFVPQPDFGAWGINDTTAQFGMQLGSSAVAAGQEYVQKNFGGIIPLSSVKHHFNVSNSYVIHKLKLVVFPWTHKSWSRRVHRSQQGQAEYQDPRDDINSPDLYIPLMAFVTYVLISAFNSGLQSRFHPEVLGQSASSALAVVFVDFLFVYIGCYLLNVQASSQAVDIIAYSGYKFVGVILTIVSSYLYLSAALYYIIFFYFFFANGLFLLRSLRSLVLPDPAVLNTSSTATISPGLRRRRISFLLIEAACQFAYMFFLVRV